MGRGGGWGYTGLLCPKVVNYFVIFYLSDQCCDQEKVLCIWVGGGEGGRQFGQGACEEGKVQRHGKKTVMEVIMAIFKHP